MTMFQANVDKVAWRVVDGEAVIVHADTSAYYGLNPSGTYIWESIVHAPLGAGEIAGRLGNRYSVDPVALRGDVESFLVRMGQEGLLLEVSPGTADGNGAHVPQPGENPGAYQPPSLSRFGELEQLVLSGE